MTEIRLNLYYPHPPERVWRAITDSRAIASWLMENDFLPRIGHRFRMRPIGLPGFDGLIEGEVTDIVQASQVRMIWRSGEAQADVVWTVKMAPGGTSLQIVHDGGLGADDVERREALEQTYAVIFEQHLPLVLHDLAVESGSSSLLAEGLPVTPAEGKDRPVEFPAAVEMDWVSAGQSSGGGVGAGQAVSGAGAYGGSLYGGAIGQPSSPVLAMPQLGSEYAWGNEISPPSGVSLGDGLSLSGYWSSDGGGFGSYGVPPDAAAVAAAERRRTRNLVLLSIGSLVAVLVFVFGAWYALSEPSAQGAPSTNLPNTSPGQPAVGVQGGDPKATKSPGTGPSADPKNPNQPGAGTDPQTGGGSNPGSGGSGGSQPEGTEPTPDDTETTTVVTGRAVQARYELAELGADPDTGLPRSAVRLQIYNPNDVDADWTVKLRWDGVIEQMESAGASAELNSAGNMVRADGSLGPKGRVTVTIRVVTDAGFNGCVIGDVRCKVL